MEYGQNLEVFMPSTMKSSPNFKTYTVRQRILNCDDAHWNIFREFTILWTIRRSEETSINGWLEKRNNRSHCPPSNDVVQMDSWPPTTSATLIFFQIFFQYRLKHGARLLIKSMSIFLNGLTGCANDVKIIFFVFRNFMEWNIFICFDNSIVRFIWKYVLSIADWTLQIQIQIQIQPREIVKLLIFWKHKVVYHWLF